MPLNTPALKAALSGRDIGRVGVPFAMLAALALVYRRLLAGMVLAGGDLHLYFYPYWSLVSEVVRLGRLPLWNPYLFAGAPLLANSQVGVFYPLNWPFWLLAPAFSSGSPAQPSVALALHGSVVAHLALASLAVYGLARRNHLSRWAGALAGLLYSAGGFLGVHVEHLNQLQALAWLPLLFLPGVEAWVGPGALFRRWSRHPALPTPPGGRLVPPPLSILALAMIVLAGHTQMAFIAGVGLLIWHGARALLTALARGEARWRRVGRALARRCVGLFPFGLAVAVAASQLLPTLQLMGLSGRQGGLAWREAVSFSVPPWQLHRVLLPPYLVAPLLPEGVAYLGLPALLIAGFGLWSALKARHEVGLGWSVLALGGLLLALGGYNPVYLAAVRWGLPGFAHFRAPSRFLALYVLGGVMLTGFGVDRLLAKFDAYTKLPRLIVGLALLVLCAVEAVVASAGLPHADATLLRAYTDLRPATAHLAAASRAAIEADQPPPRFLSISKTLFEIGDKAEIEGIYADRLAPDALWAYLVATKQREVLAPNLPAAFRVPAADGYDGGLLPTQHYMQFSHLLLPGGSVDGRLRENLTVIPERRWLALLGVRFLLTDKTEDAWVDDIFYDRQFRSELLPGQRLALAWLPPDFRANGVGLLCEGQGGDVVVDLQDGRHLTLPLLPSSEGVLRLRWDDPAVVTGLELRAPDTPLRCHGASLLDERLDAFYPLTLSDRFRLVHSGDVKIYEDVDPLPRAFVVHQCREVHTLDEALNVMLEPDFDPFRHLVMAPGQACRSDTEIPDQRDGLSGRATVVRYDAAEIVLDVETAAPGYLVLADGWYPGWEAAVTSLESPDVALRYEVLNVDLMLRAVPVESGHWRYTFRYRLGWNWVGFGISLVGLLALILYTIGVYDRR